MDANRPPGMPGARPGTVLVPQGPLTRGPAFVIDTFLVSMLVGLLLGSQAQLTRLIVVTLAAEFVYFSLFEGLLGTTLGKRLFNLRVVSARDGRPCGPLAAVVRTTLRIVDNLLLSLPGIAAIMTSPQRQRLGDMAAHTLVVVEVPEQVFLAFGGAGSGGGGGAPSSLGAGGGSSVGAGGGGGGPASQGAITGTTHGEGREGPMSADEVFRRLNELMQGQLQDQAPETGGGPDAALAATLPCPFCDAPMDPDEIVCRHCGHYVNQVTAHAEAEDYAPVPMLYSEDRNLRFDALWRLVFADDPTSLAAVCEAVATWSRAGRLLAVHTFSEVVDRRPIAFLEFLTNDPDQAVRSLARDARWRLGGR
jgi:uncharacterized RDD family membrane protein YckC